ncbi:LOW QUALITY PROTEIN: hypothetical protein NC652_023243 [Populus alba x Populus x berolinensis]|nr:LOW QUALITY PROTEIN: hypothetical protein NC652_023243 [Populus alba x Populus x berolinensis]
MALEISNDCFFTSAPTSPRGAPTSPTKGTSTDATYDLESEPTTPKIYEDANPSMDDFEFGNSRRFNIDDIHSGDSMRFDDAMKDQRKHRRQHKESFPTTAFADYFVMVMPLKPPPCHQYPTNGKFGSHSSTPTSPESQIAKIKISLSRRNVWNDDFDPFMAALKTIKGERKGKWQKINHRRARSMSPLRASSDLMGRIYHQ